MNRRDLMKKGFLGALAAKVLSWGEAKAVSVEDIIKPHKAAIDKMAKDINEENRWAADIYINGVYAGKLRSVTNDVIDISYVGDVWGTYKAGRRTSIEVITGVSSFADIVKGNFGKTVGYVIKYPSGYSMCAEGKLIEVESANVYNEYPVTRLDFLNTRE